MKNLRLSLKFKQGLSLLIRARRIRIVNKVNFWKFVKIGKLLGRTGIVEMKQPLLRVGMMCECELL